MWNAFVSRCIVVAVMSVLVGVVGVQAYFLYRLSSDASRREDPNRAVAEVTSSPWFHIHTSERPRLKPSDSTPQSLFPKGDPFAELDRIQRRIDAMFGHAIGGLPATGDTLWPKAFPGLEQDWMTGPAMAFEDRGDRYEVTMPIDESMHPQAQVQLDGQRLSIEVTMSGQPEASSSRGGSSESKGQIESSRHLTQSIYLPTQVDESTLEVTTDKGVLKVTVAKQR